MFDLAFTQERLSSSEELSSSYEPTKFYGAGEPENTIIEKIESEKQTSQTKDNVIKMKM